MSKTRSNLHTNPPSRERHKGRKVFDWVFMAPDSDKPVEVYLVHDDNGMHFRADCDTLHESVTAADINELQQKLDAVLSDKSIVMLGVQWEDWLCVEVVGSSHGCSGGVQVSYRKLKRGIHPVTQEAVTLSDRNRLELFPKSRSIDAGKDWNTPGPITSECLKNFYVGDAKEISYIPATPENLAALDELIRRIRQLRTDLAGVLSQESIRERLPQVATGQLLLSGS